MSSILNERIAAETTFFGFSRCRRAFLDVGVSTFHYAFDADARLQAIRIMSSMVD